MDCSPKLSVENSWCDFSIPIGLDHRCVHCQLNVLLTKPKKTRENPEFQKLAAQPE